MNGTMSRNNKLAKIDTNKFIDAWEAEGCLWNTKLDEYKDKNARQIAITRLGTIFEIDRDDVKSKVNSLRTYYCQEIKKEAGRKKAGEEIESKWPYFKRLSSFLRDIVSPTNLNKQRGIKKTLAVAKQEPPSNILIVVENNKQQSNIPSSLGDLAKTDSRSSLRKRKYVQVSSHAPATEEEDEDEEEDEEEEEEGEKLFEVKKVKVRVNKDDALSTFGEHIANEIHSLQTNYSQQWAKLKIQQVLFEAQFITERPQVEVSQQTNLGESFSAL